MFQVPELRRPGAVLKYGRLFRRKGSRQGVRNRLEAELRSLLDLSLTYLGVYRYVSLLSGMECSIAKQLQRIPESRLWVWKAFMKSIGGEAASVYMTGTGEVFTVKAADKRILFCRTGQNWGQAE